MLVRIVENADGVPRNRNRSRKKMRENSGLMQMQMLNNEENRQLPWWS